MALQLSPLVQPQPIIIITSTIITHNYHYCHSSPLTLRRLLMAQGSLPNGDAGAVISRHAHPDDASRPPHFNGYSADGPYPGHHHPAVDVHGGPWQGDDGYDKYSKPSDKGKAAWGGRHHPKIDIEHANGDLLPVAVGHGKMGAWGAGGRRGSDVRLGAVAGAAAWVLVAYGIPHGLTLVRFSLSHLRAATSAASGGGQADLDSTLQDATEATVGGPLFMLSAVLSNIPIGLCCAGIGKVLYGKRLQRVGFFSFAISAVAPLCCLLVLLNHPAVLQLDGIPQLVELDGSEEHQQPTGGSATTSGLVKRFLTTQARNSKATELSDTLNVTDKLQAASAGSLCVTAFTMLWPEARRMNKRANALGACLGAGATCAVWLLLALC